jgi:hypothetical protein
LRILTHVPLAKAAVEVKPTAIMLANITIATILFMSMSLMCPADRAVNVTFSLYEKSNEAYMNQ